MKNRLRFSKSHRLVTKADYNVTFDQPNKLSHRHLLILFKKTQNTYTRLGLIVGKRVAPRAVTRNRIKRVIRESFRNNQQHFIGFDIIVMARQQCDKLSNSELRKDIDKLWKKLINQYQE